jgi:DnaJ-class molecular chaperone
MEPKWRVCDFCGGDGVRTVEWNTHGEATCGTCRGTGRVQKEIPPTDDERHHLTDAFYAGGAGTQPPPGVA